MLGKVICAGLFHGSHRIVDDLDYPYIYNMSPLSCRLCPALLPFTTIRNFLLLFILALLIYCSRRRPAAYPSNGSISVLQDSQVAAIEEVGITKVSVSPLAFLTL